MGFGLLYKKRNFAVSLYGWAYAPSPYRGISWRWDGSNIPSYEIIHTHWILPDWEIRTSTNFYIFTVCEFRSLLQLTRSLHFIHLLDRKLLRRANWDLRVGMISQGADPALGAQKWVMCPESRLRSAYSILGISARNLGDTLISKWGFQSGGGGRRIKYPSLLSEFGPKVGIYPGVGRVKQVNFGNTAKSYRNWKSGLCGKICNYYGDFLGLGPKMAKLG